MASTAGAPSTAAPTLPTRCPGKENVETWVVKDLVYDLGQIDGDQRTRGLAVERVADNTASTIPMPSTSNDFTESKSETFSFHLSEQSKKLVETTTLDDWSIRARTFFQIRTTVSGGLPGFFGHSVSQQAGFDIETYVRHRLETFQSEETLTNYSEGRTVEHGTSISIKWPSFTVPGCTRIRGSLLGTVRSVNVPFNATMSPAPGSPASGPECEYTVSGTWSSISVLESHIKFVEEPNPQLSGACLSPSRYTLLGLGECMDSSDHRVDHCYGTVASQPECEAICDTMSSCNAIEYGRNDGMYNCAVYPEGNDMSQFPIHWDSASSLTCNMSASSGPVVQAKDYGHGAVCLLKPPPPPPTSPSPSSVCGDGTFLDASTQQCEVSLDEGTEIVGGKCAIACFSEDDEHDHGEESDEHDHDDRRLEEVETAAAVNAFLARNPAYLAKLGEEAIKIMIEFGKDFRLPALA